jgi:hypothetical protein
MVSEVAGSWIDLVAAEAPATSADMRPLRGHFGAVPGSRLLVSEELRRVLVRADHAAGQDPGRTSPAS